MVMMVKLMKILPMLAIVVGIGGAFGFGAKQDPCRDDGHLGYTSQGDGSAPSGTTDPRFLGIYNDDFDCVGSTPQNCHWVYVNGQWQQCDGNLRILGNSR